ncbi:hypothetical protein [Escherichia albertii]|uniref:Uncharacterized protein n=1 Tax=Escherichia albertii (strain TW07627) TaxID=502347 RepID=A0ABC9NVF8_ESCAT|nr:hypothetical protein [Escherichia albertii]EDS94123.1 hypothetical protein ESCAB7627_0422 [Escherichia albertii TW07627]EKG0288923.1 hypothetical protein [Escherichia albertii]MCZ8798231.1 hypothetical protein [Escherichia albertii]
MNHWLECGGAAESRIIVHFWDADWIVSHTTFFTESSAGNTLCPDKGG